jgi:uncharacterized RDD family membrane protein YckC
MSMEPPGIAPEYGPPSSGLPASAGAAPAEWWRRVVAIVLDGLILSIPNWIIVTLVGLNATQTDSAGNVTIHPGALAGVLVISLIVSVVYSGLLEGSAHGQSIGKMALRIQVRDVETGGPIGFGRAATRRLVYQALFLPFGIPGLINGLSPLWDARRQAWHDKTARTLVVNVVPPGA